MVGTDPTDPARRPWPVDVRLGLRSAPVVAVPRDEDLAPLSPGWRAAFDAAVAAVRATGAQVRTVDISGMLSAARLLYEGAIVAERYEAVGPFLAAAPDADPTVRSIILSGRDTPAHAYVADRAQLAAAKVEAAAVLDGCDLLLLPTTTEHPTIAAVQADPLAINRRLGTYTNFVNLLDMAAVAIPAGEADGGPFGSRSCPARSTTSSPSTWQPACCARRRRRRDRRTTLLVETGVDVLVVGAHLRGQPLNGQLEDLGARFVREVRTSDAYRLVALDTQPRKPGLVRAGPGAGAPIAGEVWRLSPGALGRMLADLPAPMSLGQVELADGTWVVGFGCTAESGAAGRRHHVDRRLGGGPAAGALTTASGSRDVPVATTDAPAAPRGRRPRRAVSRSPRRTRSRAGTRRPDARSRRISSLALTSSAPSATSSSIRWSGTS